MPKADPTAITLVDMEDRKPATAFSRRKAVMAAAFAPFMTAARSRPTAAERSAPTPAAHPDAELIAALAEFDAMENAYLDLYYGPKAIEDDHERDEAIDWVFAGRDELIGRICSMRATTIEGLAALFSTFLLAAQDIDPDQMMEHGAPDEQLLGSFYADFMAFAGLPDLVSAEDARRRA